MNKDHTVILTMNDVTLSYLNFIFEQHCSKGVHPEELSAANELFLCLKGVTRFSPEDLVKSSSEQDQTTVIQGPVSIEVNGDLKV